MALRFEHNKNDDTYARLYQCSGCGRCVLVDRPLHSDPKRPTMCEDDELDTTDRSKHRWVFRGAMDCQIVDQERYPLRGSEDPPDPSPSGPSFLVGSADISALDPDRADEDAPPTDSGEYPITSIEALNDALSKLLADTTELEQYLKRFNLFEAVGMVRQEVRHSHLFAYLLDPGQNHQLGDAFLRRLLRHLIAGDHGPKKAVTIPDFDQISLDGAVVQREWEFVDFLVEVPSQRLVLLIENKVDSSEHSNQLDRYLTKVQERYPGWNVLPVLLSPSGTRASHPHYRSLDYGAVCGMLEKVLSEVSPILPGVRIVVDHYCQMLRRHIMSDSEIAQLCREVYRKHKSALDLIFEHRPDVQSSISDLLRALIDEERTLRLVQKGKRYTTFLPVGWDDSTLLRSGQGWPFGGNRVLAFQFDNTETALTLHLWVGPVTDTGEQDRDRLIHVARSYQPPFQVAPKRFSPKFWSVYQKQFLTVQDYEEAEASDLETRVRDSWAEFLRADLLAIDRAVRCETWLWKP